MCKDGVQRSVRLKRFRLLTFVSADHFFLGQSSGTKRRHRKKFSHKSDDLSFSKTLSILFFFPALAVFLTRSPGCRIMRRTNLKVEHEIPFTTIGPAYKVRSSRWQVLCIKGMKLNLWGTCTAEARPPVKTNTTPSNATRKPEH